MPLFLFYSLFINTSLVSLQIMSISSLEIKKQFLDFFASKGHKIVPSAPIVVKGDPTLMFTNAGMNQFKDFFLGNESTTEKRITDSQKCLRVSGKHNDLDEVGHDHYHHTMFEMLGNWSFGDYFKKEAIKWAWELLTEVYKLPTDRLYVTVFEGSKEENIPFDQEAYNIWSELLPKERILNGNKKDNFWEMGETGPCGPCTEIHIDLRSDEEISSVNGASLVNADHPEVMEIWNNVFMEFNRMADGSLVSLPEKHVDTGMGFERLVRVIQKKKSNYDTDIFSYIINETSTLANIKYGHNEEQDIAFRVIADHIRAVVMVIADGQIPSNTGAGYVVRRILRRAVRYGYSYLNLQQPFMHQLVVSLAEYFKDSYPEVIKQVDFISKVIKEEETSFFKTLSTGIQKLTSYFNQNGKKDIAGVTAFELYDTYGFPIDLTEIIAREKGVGVDLDGFEKALEEQKNRSKNDAKKDLGDWNWIISDTTEEFVGYDTTRVKTQISRWREVKQKGGAFFQYVLVKSPFYAESGGQVGDKGKLIDSKGDEVVVIDTQKDNKLHVLISNKMISNPNGEIFAEVNVHRRNDIRKNHSATHLMHSALRNILGEHVAQKGSLVNDEVLRFDFSHFGKMTDEELKKIEDMVNEKIASSIDLNEYRDMPIEEAKQMGATALFGEKYGDTVRVIEFDRDFSIELCGGTHVQNTRDIGYFKLMSEGSVSAGIRRIEAITGSKAMEFLNSQSQELQSIKQLLNNPKNSLGAIEKLIEQNNQFQKQIQNFQLEKAKLVKAELESQVSQFGTVNTLFRVVDLYSAEDAKNICFQLKQQFDPFVGVLGYRIADKPGIAIIISENLIEELELNASNLVRSCGKFIQGGGGGQAFFATAGGKNTVGLEDAIKFAKEEIIPRLK